MPNTKEKGKLIEVLSKHIPYGYATLCLIAEELIAEGVTVQEWISVKDRLPDIIPCSAGTAYSEAVNVLTDWRKVLTAIWDGTTFLCDADYWEAWGEKITHWTPVLLPLPQPPKGDEPC
jgi:hypothetical protein